MRSSVLSYCDSTESTALGAPLTWSELGTLGHVSTNAYLSTPTQFSSIQILKYIDCQFIWQLDIKEGHIIHLILWKQKEEVEGETECSLHFQTCPSLDTLIGDQSRAISGREAGGHYESHVTISHDAQKKHRCYRSGYPGVRNLLSEF